MPHNMVMELEGNQNRDRWGDIYANMPVKRMVALYDYDPQELSPNVDAEVSIITDKKITFGFSKFPIFIT